MDLAPFPHLVRSAFRILEHERGPASSVCLYTSAVQGPQEPFSWTGAAVADDRTVSLVSFYTYFASRMVLFRRPVAMAFAQSESVLPLKGDLLGTLGLPRDILGIDPARTSHDKAYDAGRAYLVVKTETIERCWKV